MPRKKRNRQVGDQLSSMTAEEKQALWNNYLDREKLLVDDSKSDRREDKSDRKSDKHDYKLSKLDSKTEKSFATAAKRNALANLIKWMLIAVGVFYGMSKFGSFSFPSGGDLLEKVKGLFGS